VEGDRVQPPSHCGHPANSHVYRDRDTLIADRCQTKRIWDVAAQIRHVVDMSCLPSSTEDISLLASHIFGQGRCACKVRNRVPSYRWLFVACLGPRQELGSVVWTKRHKYNQDVNTLTIECFKDGCWTVVTIPQIFWL
jgi:hypothetical protein